MDISIEPKFIEIYKTCIENEEDQAYAIVGKIQGIHPAFSNAFGKKYNPEKKLTTRQAFAKFYEDVKAGVYPVTPIGDEYNRRLLLINPTPESEVKNILPGDYIIIAQNEKSSGAQGFVKKVARTNLIIETTYGGWGGSDVSLMELKLKISNITRLHKPKSVV